MRAKHFVTIVIFILITSFKEKDPIHIWYDHQSGTTLNCTGQEVEMTINITTGSKRPVKVHSFRLDSTEFTLYNFETAVAISDTLILTQKTPIFLHVKFRLPPTGSPQLFEFRTNVSEYDHNEVKLSYGQMYVSSQDVRKGREVIVNVSESCTDSVTLVFPYGGTVSSATLFPQADTTGASYKSIVYGFGEPANSMTFKKSDAGKYKVHFSSCHWGNTFWLTIK